MIYVKVNGTLYPATIDGQMQNYQWDNRESKVITMQGTYDEIVGLFKDGTPWSIVMKETVQKRNEDGSPVLDKAGNPVTEEHGEHQNGQAHGPGGRHGAAAGR